MCYMLSAVYDLSVEHSLSVLDPAIGLPLSQGPEPVLSGRDLTAPTLGQALELDLLPRYADCVPLTTESAITR
jgi:5-epimerase